MVHPVCFITNTTVFLEIFKELYLCTLIGGPNEQFPINAPGDMQNVLLSANLKPNLIADICNTNCPFLNGMAKNASIMPHFKACSSVHESISNFP